ncbi:MAG: hypothetical protein GX564_09410 [Oligosphaeraceae bacterium]|nr:hypothetical protein [Oligosphaeraceae bacterium]
MCNMAAYAGREAAAPILLRMLEAQEGLGGGHYSGIATLHEGKIHLAKVCGACSRLRTETAALHLPGCVGIAHSRTPGIPLNSWAQPFQSSDAKVVYCANGSHGHFANCTDFQAWYDLLLNQGVVFPSEVDYAVKPYPVLANGHSLHSTELSANILAYYHAAGDDMRLALRKTFQTAPSEIASLALSTNEPQQVSAARLNQPLMWGEKNHSFYLATSALAFVGENLHWVNPVPAACTLSMSADTITFSPMEYFDDLLEPAIPHAEATRILDQLLADGQPRRIGALCDAIKPCWPQGKLPQAAMLAYEYLREGVLTRKIRLVASAAPATRPGDEAPLTLFQKNL